MRTYNPLPKVVGFGLINRSKVLKKKEKREKNEDFLAENKV